MADQQHDQQDSGGPATGAAEDPTFAPPDRGSEHSDQSELGDAGKRALASERQARKDLERQLKDLKPLADRARELEDAQKTEQQRLTERAEAAEQQLTEVQQQLQEAAVDALRQRVAAEKGLPGPLAARLRGGDEEELAADADALLAAYPPPEPARATQQRPVEMLRPGAVPDSDGASADMSSWMRNKAPTTN